MAEEKTNRQTDTGAGKTAGGKFNFVLAEDHATELLPALDAQPTLHERAADLLQDLLQRMHGDTAAVYATLSNWAAADAEGGNDESDKHTITLLAKDAAQGIILRDYLQQRGFYEDTAGNFAEWKKAPADDPAEPTKSAAEILQQLENTMRLLLEDAGKLAAQDSLNSEQLNSIAQKCIKALFAAEILEDAAPMQQAGLADKMQADADNILQLAADHRQTVKNNS